MKSWSVPSVPVLPGTGTVPSIFDTRSGRLVKAQPEGNTATLYVCGITPYDATHIGHAATYLVYDLLLRVWQDAGLDILYAQNVTDVDDPLLERASATGVDWRDLAQEQTDLFRSDMQVLSIIPPQHYVAVTDSIDHIAAGVDQLLKDGFAYRVPVSGTEGDVYFDNEAAARLTEWSVGSTTPYDPQTLEELNRERGGDPDRPGKKSPLDPLLWLAEREGEPSWESPVGRGRPGWHVECSVIAVEALGSEITVQGGGVDLVFPHHDFSAGHALALNNRSLAKIFNHAALVSYRGEKMSKSKGNLEFISRLTTEGIEPAAIRLTLLAQHYRTQWEWKEELLHRAQKRLALWRSAFTLSPQNTAASALPSSGEGNLIKAHDLLSDMRSALSQDLDAPTALQAVDTAAVMGVDDPALVLDAVDSLLGIKLHR
ncbi:cysteine--1-D-myo-inosityl 2-amino-2-deoxy-alpha-D-glucopyranoside ligase [Lysinibacter sp. HNR]|uniref:cysteine--1-D-myo-inosityl 2-amino-2-deoxy-alpha-D-glucopyranoside ligase n=1 Tax=Lysinibacter sp. HNR TaxID=3031408 RepID=UPI002435F8FC|nr:cysteine--1-D-myo-inosityl 2-amino-2-deoxy-alpha-D-glucopyranoside ligase [Lysinibacter sp. HNR]WGD36214.1 cysteine--1-D-myo-inosityl 2-amino-2-deoxy-alpha-D-glucopyranoside ligase [Lysinibacter sp. HNR]